MKRLVLFYDGTCNTPRDRTNVWRTHELLADHDGPIPQLKHYVPGVGTEVGEIAAGSIFGTGVARKIREGYAWLIDHFEEGDEIFVFGFSRGAFTARSLVQMLASCGLTRQPALAEWSVAQAFAWYDGITQAGHNHSRPIWRLRYWAANPAGQPPGWTASAEEQILLDNAKVAQVKVKFAGLWDTVGAMGSDALANRGALTQKSAEHNVRPTRALLNSYHAIALDEHRPMFDVTLWRAFVPAGTLADTMQRYTPHYEQRWFVGAHSDVGGGYDDDDDSLPDLSLAWMLSKATACGLVFTSSIVPQPNAHLAPIHDSYESFALGVLTIWNEIIPGDQRRYRTTGRTPFPVKTGAGLNGALCSINEVIDPSVIQRWTTDPTYRPPSLVDYFKRHPAELPAGTSLNQRTKRIYAARYWNETGVFLRPDTTYRLKLVPGQGEPLRDAGYLSPSIAGANWQSSAHRVAALLHAKRMHAAPWFALIATIDEENPWVVQHAAPFSVKHGGQLVCYFNDVQLEWFYRNNSGWVVLEVEEV